MKSKNNEVCPCPTREGCYFVKGQSWQVGTRYTVHKLLGSGSFSSVCLATDNRNGQKVALKRIPNVLHSVDNAKKVLREVCIMRRLSHPNIISLKDAFVRPSETGPFRYQGGQLIPISIDVYLVMEYASEGDLFHLRGQLSEQEVIHLMWQLLNAVKYFHSQNVWHRDFKSANVLLTMENGMRVAKVADFGSARSACSFDDDALVEQLTKPVHSHGLGQPSGGMEPPLTRQVCTPCYRAPEVVMSRGGYTSSLDMWSLGCIFAELLQRIAYVGSATTPQLQIRPVFAATGFTETPTDGDRYVNGPSRMDTRAELESLFDVIGTPAWACIRAVKSDGWRKYLTNLPLRSGKLNSRFGFAGDAAVDLLSRLLTFDPSRRCTAVEAMMHELFRELNCQEQNQIDQESFTQEACDSDVEVSSKRSFAEMSRCHSMTMVSASLTLPLQRSHSVSPPGSWHSSNSAPLSPARYFTIADPAKALAALESEMFNNSHCDDGCSKLRTMLEGEIDALSKQSDRELFSEVIPTTKTSPTQILSDSGRMQMSGQRQDLVRSNPQEREKPNMDVEKHLFRGRHSEWTETSGMGPPPGPAWGVSCVPPGLDETTLDPQLREIIQSQQMR